MFTQRELLHTLIAIIALSIVISFGDLIALNFLSLGIAILFAFIIIALNILAKKWAAYALDANVQHSIWTWERYGYKPHHHFKSAVPTGIIIPAVLTVFSLGIVKCMTFLTYETTALKRRAARRFGFYSFTEMTDWHNALIGGAGIVAVLLLAMVAYFVPGLEGLPSLAIYYAFWNIIPVSKLDGAQILFGSLVLYTALALVTVVMTLATFVII